MPKPKPKVKVLGRRTIAIIIDYLVLYFISYTLVYIFSPLKFLPATTARPAGDYHVEGWTIRIVAVLAFYLYYILSEWLAGATLGKFLVNIRVKNENIAKITLAQSIIRNTIRIIDYLPVLYLVGFLIARTNNNRQRLGDKAAKTLVVAERSRFII